MLEAAVTEAPSAEVLDSNTDGSGVWIEALPARIYHTPQYGDVPITPAKLERFITNFNDNVRGVDIATDYEHGIDPAKGKQASGWYRGFELRPSSDDPTQQSLFAKVEFTDDAKADIKAGKWKYWSLEWDDEYLTDNGELVPDVVLGGGLTNRPIAKRTMPINFSEEMWNSLDDDTRKQFAVWSTKYVNSLPDSSFLYIEKEAGESDTGGETKKENRHLPYKDANGKVDLPHLRNAIARIPQMKGISDALKKSLQAKARRILAAQTKAASEHMAEGTREAYDLLVSQGFEIYEFSNAAMEHSDPGIGAPLYASANNQPDPGTGQYVARTTGDPAKDDPAIGGGFRRDPLPVLPTGDTDPIDIQESRQGGTMQLSEHDAGELMRLVGVTEEDKFMEAARIAFGELKQFKDSVGQSQQEKKFAEEYPILWAEHQELVKSGRETAAKTFSESVSRISRATGEGENIKMEPTRNGLSALALETLAEVHVKFSEGSADIEDFEKAVKTIVNGGIVEFGEVGSSAERELPEADSTTASGRASARKQFAEKVAEVKAAHAREHNGEQLDTMAATQQAATLYPELAEAYRATA